MRGGVETQPLWEEDRGRVGREGRVGGGQREGGEGGRRTGEGGEGGRRTGGGRGGWEEDRGGREGRVGGMEIFFIYTCTMYEW